MRTLLFLAIITFANSLEVSCDSRQWSDTDSSFYEPLRIIACEVTPAQVETFFACKCSVFPVTNAISNTLLTHTMSCGPMISIIFMRTCFSDSLKEWQDRIAAKRIKWNEVLQPPTDYITFEKYRTTPQDPVRPPHIILGTGHAEIPNIKYITINAPLASKHLHSAVQVMVEEFSCKNLQLQNYLRGKEDGSRDYSIVASKLQQVLNAAEQLRTNTHDLNYALTNNLQQTKKAVETAISDTVSHCISVKSLHSASVDAENSLLSRLTAGDFGKKLNAIHENVEDMKDCLVDGMGQEKLELLMKRVDLWRGQQQQCVAG